MHRAALLVGLLALGALGPATAAAAPRVTQQATIGAVSATLSWTAPKRAFDGVLEPRLQITRAGAVALDAGLGDLCDRCSFNGTAEEPNVELHDLDGDGEPEVLVSAYTGGAHCCTDIGIWDFRASLGTYGHLVHPFGNGGAVVQDVDGDGSLELRSVDDRFAYTFAAYAFSARPPQVLRWSRTPRVGLTDVTRRFPKLIRADAADLRRALRTRSRDVDLRGPLAAYVADEYLLGRGAVGRAEIARLARRGRLGSARDTVWPGGRRFRPRLLAFLRRTGYR